MYQEVEIKLLGISKKDFLMKMEEIRAKMVFDGLMRVKYFDFEDQRIRKIGELLRLRVLEEGEKKDIELVYKFGKKTSEVKFFQELQINLDDDEEKLEKIFFHLGLNISKYYEKKRISFEFEKCKLEFDEYPNGFGYLEIEANDEHSLNEVIKFLGWENKEKSFETVDEIFERMFAGEKLDGMSF